MQLFIAGVDVTQLAASITTTGSQKECSRTLSADIVQSPSDVNLPVVQIAAGMPVVLNADGQYFVGSIQSPSRSTSSNTVSFTAKDHGIFIKRNKITFKVEELTAETAAADICAEYGVPTGLLAPTGFQFSRNFVNVSLYDAIMTGYSMAAAESEKKYYLYMDGTAVCVGERGDFIAAVIVEGENLIEATYSESIENMVNQVDIYDKDGILVQSVQGDTSFGIMREQITLTDSEDGVAKAEEMIRDKGLTRSGTVQNIGNPACISGNAIMVQERFTGLWGQFYIDSDTHAWKNGVYTNRLTLAWESTMDTKSAGTAIEASKKKTGSSSGGTPSAGGHHINYAGERIDWE